MIVEDTEPIDPFEKLRVSVLKQNFHIILAKMAHIKKPQSSAYHAVKLASEFMTEQECVTFISGMVKT